jgi:hypothetical protein
MPSFREAFKDFCSDRRNAEREGELIGSTEQLKGAP